MSSPTSPIPATVDVGRPAARPRETPSMDYRQLVRGLAAGRVVLGTSLLLAPGLIGAGWIGEVARRREVKIITRAAGIRDLALGLGTLQALTNGDPARTWAVMAGLSDAVDLGTTALVARRIGLRRSLPVMLAAVAAVTITALAADDLD
jgi:hypothetical protein